MARWLFSFLILMIAGLQSVTAQVQRGQIIKSASTTVMDPNQDGFVSGRNPQTGVVTPNTPFSNIGYYVPEFEIPMFGLPKIGDGDVAGDNIGKICGVTDLIPDKDGYSVYAARDNNNNLIFRFRVGSDQPSVEAYTILLDTDGLFGANDPDATGLNPGFEIDITLIKRQNAGIYVYDIDGISSCPTPILSYSYNTHFQISVADEVTCGNPDYFYDFYVPFGEIANALGIDEFTGLRYAAVTNVSATCAMAGKIADIGGVDYDDYKDCIACAFTDIIESQCPTPIVDLREDGPGFDIGLVNPPNIDEPIKAGQTVITGTSESGLFIKLDIFPRSGGTDEAPIWSTTARETHITQVVNDLWSITLNGPLQAYDRIVARAQKNAEGVDCGLGAGNEASSTSITVVEPNELPIAFDQEVEVFQNSFVDIVLVATDADNDPLTYTIVSQPTNGTLTGTGANVRYTPNSGYLGPDSFSFVANDGAANSNIGIVSIQVIPVNQPPNATPVAAGDCFEVIEDTPKVITLQASDPDGDALTFIIVTQPLHGVLTGSGPEYTYTPNANYFGADSFTFKVNDGQVDSNVAGVCIDVINVNDPPVATPVTDGNCFQVTENIAKVITLQASDPEGDALTYIIVTGPSHGTLIGTGPNFTYTPNTNYFGPDSFTFKVNDGEFDSNVADVCIDVINVNDPPTATPVLDGDCFEVIEDTPKVITLQATDPDGDVLTYIIVTVPAHGVLTGTGPDFTYTPNADYFGPDSFTFIVNDGEFDSNVASVCINVINVNDPPVAIPVTDGDCFEVIEDTPKVISLQATDPDGDVLIFIIVTGPAHGVLTGTGPDFTYTPNADYFGPDSFTFKVNDGEFDSNEASVCIDVINVNDPPTATPVLDGNCFEVIEDTPKVISLQATDPDGDVLTYIIVTGPANGVLTGTGPDFTYTPNADYFGPDSFTFKVNDGEFDSNVATVCINVVNVNDPPTATPVLAGNCIEVIEDTPKEITLQATDPDGDVLTYIIVSGPSHGTLTGTGSNFTYTPNANYFGPDSFIFKVNDGEFDSNEATVCIEVLAVNDPPFITGSGQTVLYEFVVGGVKIDENLEVFDVDDSTIEGVIVSITQNFKVDDELLVTTEPGIAASYNAATGVLTLSGTASLADYSTTIASIIFLNDTEDPVGAPTRRITLVASDALESGPAYHTFVDYPGNANAPILVGDDTFETDEDTSITICLDATDADGDAIIIDSFVYTGNGTIDYIGGLCFIFTPEPDFNGTEEIEVVLCDVVNPISERLCSGPITITIIILPVNDPPVAVNDIGSTVTNVPVTFNITANDYDIEDVTVDPSTIDLDPSSPGKQKTFTVAGQGTYEVDNNGDLTFTPAFNFQGVATPIFYTVEDNDGALSNQASITVTVNLGQLRPVAVDDDAATNKNIEITFNITDNDYDTDGNIEPSTVDLDPSTGGEQKTFVVAGEGEFSVDANGNVTFTPEPDFSGTVVITYTVKDNDGLLSNVATITVEVDNQNNPPIILTDPFEFDVLEDTPTDLTLSATDADGDALTYIIVTQPSHGTLTGSGPTFTYTPDPDYNGPDSFTFKVNDGTDDSNVATVLINVIPVNDPPVADDQSVTTTMDTAVSITLSGSDVDGDAITFIIVTQPDHGTLTGSGATWTYTPDTDYLGGDSFTFKVNDGEFDSDIATVSITVVKANTPPVATEDLEFDVPQDTPTDITLSGSDDDGDALTYIIVSPPGNGILTGTGPVFTYTPNPGFTGTDTFTFKVNDGTEDSDVVTVIINVIPTTPVNIPPVAEDDEAETEEETPVTFNITDNDTDADGVIDPATVDLDPATAGEQKTFTVSGEGTFTVDNEGNVTFTPVAGFIGTSSITYTVKDDDGALSNEATISVIVTETVVANTAPVADDLSFEVNQDTSKDVTLTGSDADGDALTFIIVTQPTNGTLTGSGPTYTYTPDAGYTGADSFTFKVNDGTEDSNVATVSITVVPVIPPPVNRAPVISAIPILYVPQDSTLLVCLGVTDLDGNNITYGVPTRLSGEGAMAASTEFGFCYVYTPPAGYTGETRWNIGVCDDGVPILCDDIDITIIVLKPPVAENDSTTTFINTMVSFNIFENDYAEDTELNVLSIDLNPATAEEEKTVEVSGDGSFVVDEAGVVTFTPANNFLGEVIINYTIKDNFQVRSNAASIKVKVETTPIPANPNDLFFDALEDVPTDIELTSPGMAEEDLTFIVITQPVNGTLTGTVPNLVYLSNLNYNGPDQFTFRVNNGFNNSETATAFINVIPVNDPPTAVNDTVSVQNDQSITFNALANDFDIDGDNIFMDVNPLSGPSNGTVTFMIDGTVTYTPFETFVGQDIISYRIFDDGSPVLYDTAFIFINVVLPPFKIYNAISPNGDGQNDYWRIDAIESFANNHVRVFDRYNNLVFEMKNYRNNDPQKSFWGESNRGLSSGIQLAEGTYYYVVDIGDGTKPVSGYIMLKRN